MTKRIVEIRVAFWVQKEQWLDFGPWLISRGNQPLVEKQVRDLEKTLEEVEPRVFLDGTTLREMYLGQVNFKAGECLPDSELTSTVMAVLWDLADFLVEFRLGEDCLQICSADQQKHLITKFAACLHGLLDQAIGLPPEYLGSVLFYEDEQFAQVKQHDEVQQYLDSQFNLGVRSADVYWSSQEISALFLLAPQVVNQPSHVFVSSSPDVLRPLAVEVEHLLWHQGLRKMIGREIDAARSEATRALTLRDNLGKLAAQRLGVISLLSSIYKPPNDLSPELSQSIVDLSKALLKLQDSQMNLRTIRTVFEEDLFWRGNVLLLYRAGVARGRLVKITEADVGQLSLGAYLRRSALQILEFYDQRIDETCSRLKGILESYQTLLDVRSTQQSDLLNSLVLILTVVSALLALFQVLSAFDFWRENGHLAILAGAFVVVALITLALARLRARRMRRKAA